MEKQILGEKMTYNQLNEYEMYKKEFVNNNLNEKGLNKFFLLHDKYYSKFFEKNS